MIGVLTYGGVVEIRDAMTGDVRLKTAGIGQSAYEFALAWSPDSRYIAYSTESTPVQLLDSRTGVIVERAELSDRRVKSLAWSPDGRYLASGGVFETVQLWDVMSRRVTYTWHGNFGQVWGVCWSPDGRYVASGGWDDTVQVWKPGSGV